MRKTNTQPMKEVIQLYLKALKIDDKIKEAKIIGNWNKSMGVVIAKATTDLYIRNRVLYVHVNSPAIRNDLNLMRSEVVKHLNRQVGENVITDLILKGI